jgi:hypothetical protein
VLVDLAQVVTQLDVHVEQPGQRFGGLAGTHHGAGHDVVDVFGGEERGDGHGLGPSESGQGRVGGAFTLAPLFAVGTGVSDDDEIHGGASARGCGQVSGRE